MKSAYWLLAATLWTAHAQSIQTLVGNGIAGPEPAINNPYGLVIGPDGALYFCEIGNHKISRLDMKTNGLSTIAGSGKKGYAGDGGPATAALLNEPYDLRFDTRGNLYFVEMQNHVLRRVDAKTHIITTVAGNGSPGFSGDGGPAAKAQFKQPHSIEFDPHGDLLICDIGNNRIRKITLKTGMIDTWAGDGTRGKTPDGANSKDDPLNGPRAIALALNGDLYVVLREGNAVYRIDGKTSKIYRFAGTGETGYSGDNGPAMEAKFAGPKGISISRNGVMYLADTENHAIRSIDLGTGVIRTVAGTGKRGDGPDGDPMKCQLARPHGVFVAANGVIYIGDSEAHRVRKLVLP